jgi:hypothetical protein
MTFRRVHEGKRTRPVPECGAEGPAAGHAELLFEVASGWQGRRDTAVPFE